jgi:DNA excision repair protein ERCC-4
MERYYKVPTLLVEFQPEKAFALQTSGEISPDIQTTSIVSKLVLLTLHFPSLRILWSRSSHASVEIFKALKANNAEVDVEKAMVSEPTPGPEGVLPQAGRIATGLNQQEVETPST